MVDLTGNWDSRISRRTLLRTGGAAAIVLYGNAIPSADAGPRFAGDPFTLGVASGEPTPDGIVLWTRLAPDPLNGGGLGLESYRVRFEVAKDPRFRRIVHRGHTRVIADDAHTVHAEVTGLRPEEEYWYRFESKRWESPVGRFKTAPRYGRLRRHDHLKFAFVSCQNFTHGYFSPFEDLAKQSDVELVVHLGDYIYEGPGLVGGPRVHAPAAALMTLNDYRTRHAQYKTDPWLQAVHREFPWVLTWDDHEFWQNYADLDVDSGPDQTLESLIERRAAAYKAYWEHNPLPHSRKPAGHNMPMYRRSTWGDLVLFHVLDTRQHRSDQVANCPVPQRQFGYCPPALDPERAILGAEQRTWLFEGLDSSTARWNVLANQVRFAPLDQNADPNIKGFLQDNWDGYVADRQRVLDFMREQQPSNPIVITGDAHVHSVRNVPPNFQSFDGDPVAVEFVGSSITSEGDTDQVTPTGNGRLRFNDDSENPHRLFQTDRRGYVTVDVTPDTWKADFRTVTTVLAEESPATTVASYVVQNGQAGAIREFPPEV
jgi:alkaline phosphatase D